MLYVTGDTHGRKEILKKRLKQIRRKDVLLVLGDFGFVWDGGKEEQKRLAKLGKRAILFLDGANENHELLASYPVVDFCGGKARHITGKLYQLLRGETYAFGDAVFFAFGGAETDADLVDTDEKAAKYVQPTLEEMKNGVRHLAEREGKIDCFVTHEAPSTIRATLTDSRGGALNEYLDRVMKESTFVDWYFGCYHIDRSVSKSYHAVYHKVFPTVKTDAFTADKIASEREKSGQNR